MDTLFVLLAVVVVLAGVLGRRRMRDRVRDGASERFGDDDAIDDDAIDEDAIRAAEDEFWEKDWEEPEEWGR